MKDCIFTLVDGKKARENPNEAYPKIIQEAFQVFECTWVKRVRWSRKMMWLKRNIYHHTINLMVLQVNTVLILF